MLARTATQVGHGQSAADQAGEDVHGGKAVKAVVQPANPPEGPWLATRRFFAPYDPPTPSLLNSPAVDLQNPADLLTCTGEVNCAARLRQFFGVRETDRIECLLATVPDPYHTRLALATDNTIDGIWKGAGATDWQFSTQWLPWNDTVDPKEGDPAQRAAQREYIREQERQPGVLVFRRAEPEESAAPETLLVFVVGETPTAGVNPEQFQIARAYMEALCHPYRNVDKVRIVGPVFSGSFHSLAELIVQDKLKHPGKSYQVRSGTATSLHAKEAFDRRAGPSVEFYAATENIRDQRNQFLELVDALGIPRDRAAVLAEAGSAYGRAAAQAVLQEDLALREDVRVFRFPRDISHLRDSYRQAVQSSQSGDTSTPSLDFSLKDSRVGEDSVPTYSQTQTPLSQNGVINEIVRTVRRGDIRILEVSATNVLDLLFLAGVLRRQCPDTRLLIDSADLLFVQAEQTQPVDGALFLSSYPLFTESKLWEERREILVFPDARSEGVYDATVLLLGTGIQRQRVLDYAWRQVHHPAAWLLTLDRRGFVPVRIFDRDTTPGWFEPIHGTRQGPAPGRMPPPRPWNLLSGAFALFGATLAIWMFCLRWNGHLRADARFEPMPSEETWHGFFLLLFLLILIGIQIAIFVARPPGDGLQLIKLAGPVLPAVVAVLYCRPGAKRRQAMCLAAAAVLLGVGLWSFCCLEKNQGGLFSFRAAELRFGSSPLWPIVAAAAALLLWCFVHLTRLYLASCGQPEAITSGVEILKGRLKNSYEEFRDAASAPLGLFTRAQSRWLGVALAVSWLLFFLFRVKDQLASIDGAPYDSLCIALQFLVAGLLLLTCWHIRALWKSLHCFTTNLALLPVARDFIRLSPPGGNRPIWVRRCNLLSLEVHTNSMLVLHDMGLQSEQLSNHGLTLARVSWWCRLYRDRIADLLSVDPSRSRQSLAKGHRNLWRLNKLVATQLWQLTLIPTWRSQALFGKLTGGPAGKPTEQAPDEHATAQPGPRQDPTMPGDPRSIPDLAGIFVALHYSPFLLYGVRQIQNLLWFPSVGFVLLMFSMSSYSFQAPRWIGRFLMVLFAMITWTLGRCVAQMERDPILSRIAGTHPGELGADFYLKMARYGALPVLGVLASQFPSISNFLLSWVEPALEALK